MFEKNFFILVTGLPRSGSTWVSQALAEAAQTHLVHEPFNWQVHPERIAFHMKYIPAGEDDQDLLAILRQRVQRAPIETLTRYAKKPWKLLEQMNRLDVLVKDVHICLAIEYIWEVLKPQIVILVRHPCAMAQSWQRLDLKVRFRIDNLLAQERLVGDHLAPFARHLKQRGDFFFSFGAYWGASYYVMAQLSQHHPSWQWATHETLCFDSVDRFSALLERLGTGISPQGRRGLGNFIQRTNRQQEDAENAHSVARLTALEPEKWKSQLSKDQIESIYNGSEPFGIFDKYYTKD